MTARRLVPTDQQLVRSLRSQARSQALGDARLKLRDPSQLGEPRGWFGQSTSGGGCLTATSTTYTFDPTANGGSGAVTARWRPNTTMNLTAIWARCAFPPSGGDVAVTLWDAESFTQKGSTVTLVDSTSDEASWTGTVSVDTGMRLYFEVDASVSVDLYIVEAWFDGPAGGGLILYPEGGV